MTEPLLSEVQRIVDEAHPAMSAMPADCTNNCGMGPCDCSGQYQVIAWSIDVPALREFLVASTTAAAPPPESDLEVGG